MCHRLFLALTISCFLFAPGCAKSKQAALQKGSLSLGDTVDQSAMVMGTERLLADSYVNMVTVSAEAAQTTEQMDVREGSIRWRIVTANQLDRIHTITDPRVQFAALWTLAVQLRISFTEGVDKKRFGDQQYRYTDFAKAFEKSVVDLGYKAFPDEVVRQVIPEIDQMARTVGVSGWFIPEANPNKDNDALAKLISVPLSPISGLQGVGDTPAAINHFTDVAQELTRVVNNLPERTRWQTELMLLEAQTSGAFSAALKEGEDIRKSVDKLGTNVPEQVRQLLQDPKLAETLALVKSTSEQIGRNIKNFQQASADVRQTLIESEAASAAVQKAASEVRAAAEVIRGPKPSATQPENERDKFRITDVEAAAVHVQAAAKEIHDLATDLRNDRWSVALFIALAFLAGVGLLVIARILRRPKSA